MTLFKDEKLKISRKSFDKATIEKALQTTMNECIASTSALVINPLTKKIVKTRMDEYNKNSCIAMNAIGIIRSFLFKISKYMEEKELFFFDASAAVRYTIAECRGGNCEHQAFYLTTLLRQQNIPALIYDIEDIQHSVVITNGFLLDPWAGVTFSLSDKNIHTFYGSSLNMNASWLNRLLSNKEFMYPQRLNLNTLSFYFAQPAEDLEVSVPCCPLL